MTRISAAARKSALTVERFLKDYKDLANYRLEHIHSTIHRDSENFCIQQGENGVWKSVGNILTVHTDFYDILGRMKFLHDDFHANIRYVSAGDLKKAYEKSLERKGGV